MLERWSAVKNFLERWIGRWVMENLSAEKGVERWSAITFDGVPGVLLFRSLYGRKVKVDLIG